MSTLIAHTVFAFGKRAVCACLLFFAACNIANAVSIPTFNSEEKALNYLNDWDADTVTPNRELVLSLNSLVERCREQAWYNCAFKGQLVKIEVLTSLERMSDVAKEITEAESIPLNDISIADSARLNIAKLNVAIHTGNDAELTEVTARLYKQIEDILATEGNKGVGDIYIAIGRSQAINYQYAEAIQSLQKAYIEFDRIGDLPATGTALVSLGNVYSAIDNLDKAQEYFELALTTERQLGNKFSESIILFNMAQTYFIDKQVEKAKSIMLEALEISESLNDEIGIMWTKLELANIEVELKNYKKALALYHEVEPTFIYANDPTLLYAALFGMAKAHLELGNIERADFIMIKTAALFEYIRRPTSDAERLTMMSKLLLKQGEYDRAYEALEQAMEVKIDIKMKEKANLVQKYQVEFDTKLKEQQNAALLQQNRNNLAKIAQQERERNIWYIVILAITLCTIVLVIFLFQQNRLRKQFKAMAMRDPLTSQPNRRSVLSFAEMLFREAKERKLEIGIAIIDLDHFKKINDKFGHDTGDNVLMAFGAACKEVVRSQDGFGRYGGEEWLLVLAEVNESQIESIFKRLAEVVNKTAIEGLPNDEVITFSMGAVSITPSDKMNLREIIQHADKLLYKSKDQGRNQMVSEKLP
ncbi:diguanylate cyclase [Glaciecola sp. 2405UD65-10]|uniref:tetratricopeptide repeat-containing diguanylate cyclase n=1 Tax=Glaciecola sp. 2405UD65-10 TaxID=3397244 RepID=UPI003B5B6F61